MSQAKGRNRNSSDLAIRYDGRGIAAAETNGGSFIDTWLLTMSVGPLAGRCSRPSRRKRKTTKNVGTQIARPMYQTGFLTRGGRARPGSAR